MLTTDRLLRRRWRPDDRAAPFTPAVEIGWRLAPAYQGRGLATEAARACLDFGFNNLGLSEIVAFTVPDNTASRRVMDKLGMTYDERDNFEHPNVPSHDPLRHNLLDRRQAPAS